MTRHLLLLTAVAMHIGAAYADGAPVYKCTYAGHTAYSEDPCLGATVVNTTPTQGMDKSSGRSRKGRDVQREEFHEGFANAIKPITGMTPDQLTQYGRRMKLQPKDQAQCMRLDADLPNAELADKQARGDQAKAQADVTLYLTRKQFRDLGC